MKYTNNKQPFEKLSDNEEKRKYILRKRQEWEDNKELREFFYTPLEYPVKEDERGNKES